MERLEDGWFTLVWSGIEAGTRYKFRLPHGDFPDPASRFQPDGPHGFSEVVDPDRFEWSDAGWHGGAREGQVIYELHVGTFGGTWAAASERLPSLADLGVTVLEVMPVAAFPGRFGWGYDGVDLFAPSQLYGTPDDFRRFVDCAHALRMGVILDVVYNHLGPDGNFLGDFSTAYFTDRYKNEWGRPLNFDGPDAGPVRALFVSNAAHWISEYHLDGLRLDATQQICDSSKVHILREIAGAVRAAAAGRDTFLVAENEPQDAHLVRSVELGGFGLDALWNDDFHHSAVVALSGKHDAYYSDYTGCPQELVSVARHGFLYQGQRYRWQGKPRGTSAMDLASCQFVTCLQNHDQVANSLRGRRVHCWSDPGRLRAMTAFLLLGPGTPMLFQGQEFAASSPFLYFADHHPELAAAVAEGRKEFLRQFPNIAQPGVDELLFNPANVETFEKSRLDFGDIERHREIWNLHRDLIHLRRSDSVLGGATRQGLDGAVLGGDAFLLRYFGESGDDRLLLFNLGNDPKMEPAPEPLLAPSGRGPWKQIWHSEDPRYGGDGSRALEEEPWTICARSAVVLKSSSP